MGLLGMGFGLLKMLKMPEVKKKIITTFSQDSVDTNTISYK
jgi:hypothetical protein